MSDEPRAVAARYARRGGADRYGALQPDVWQTLHERQRAMLALFARHGLADPAAWPVLELGSGSGGNLLELLRLGFAPEQMTGLELLPERHAEARRVLPTAVTLWQGDALQADIAPASQGLVLIATVFSSLLDDDFQRRLAARAWQWVRPGGAVLWYDFTVGNPRNPDVRGVPLARVRQLFPQANIDARRVTLAPPLARVVCRWHPGWYRPLAAVPGLRTHLLAWLGKPGG